jgi:hypothetical protein
MQFNHKILELEVAEVVYDSTGSTKVFLNFLSAFLYMMLLLEKTTTF